VRDRKILSDFGYFVPVSSTGRAGFHELPWLIKKANLKLLRRDWSIASAEEVLWALFRQADVAGSHTIICSSEDLSLLLLAEWRQLFKLVELASQAQGVEISGLAVTWSPREISDAARSAYSTLVRLGLTRRFQEVSGFLQEHFLLVQETASNIAEASSLVVESRVIPHTEHGFLEKWARVNLEDASLFESPGVRPAKVNRRDSSRFTERLRRDNLSRAILFEENHLFEWWRYHDEDSIASQRNAVRRLVGRRP
jgi:hypothetical protein